MRHNQVYSLLRKGADITLQPQIAAHTHTLVFLHGLGDSADGFLDLFSNASMSPAAGSMKIVLPTAPTRAVTINGGMKMPAWYDKRESDMSEANFAKAVAVDHAYEQAKRIGELLHNEINTLNGQSNKVFLGGFSQGAAMALLSGLTFDKQLGGLLAFSGFNFPAFTEHQSNSTTPILISHGRLDQVLPWAFMKKSYERIDSKAHNVKLHLIPDLEHSLNLESLNVFKEFLVDHSI